MFDGVDGSGGPAGEAAAGNPAAVLGGNGSAESPLRLCGALDGDAALRLRDHLAALSVSAEHDVIVDLEAVGFMDGAGVGALSFLFRRLATRRLRLAIVGQPEIFLL